ncbi:hypothetical protein OF83DRAFT_1109648 [Amylostereum chailletii]|nr:hypothetical protein OF83DRAFT_1109648 [Amylostereum chailletii]
MRERGRTREKEDARYAKDTRGWGEGGGETDTKYGGHEIRSTGTGYEVRDRIHGRERRRPKGATASRGEGGRRRRGEGE